MDISPGVSRWPKAFSGVELQSGKMFLLFGNIEIPVFSLLIKLIFAVPIHLLCI